MKYIKKYESISIDLKKYDLILSKSLHSFYDYDLYILLENVTKNKRKLKVLHIAEISFHNFNYIDYEIVNVDEEILYKNANIRVLNKKEKNVLFNWIISRNDNRIKKTLIEKIDYDITSSEDYQNYIISQSQNKYNL